VVRTHVLKVRLSDDELGRLDAAVGLRGGTRAGLTRRFLADGLLEMGLARELTLQEALAPFASPDLDWRAAAAALEKQFPERWADPAA
jgi:hypothetical protein